MSEITRRNAIVGAGVLVGAVATRNVAEGQERERVTERCIILDVKLIKLKFDGTGDNGESTDHEDVRKGDATDWSVALVGFSLEFDNNDHDVSRVTILPSVKSINDREIRVSATAHIRGRGDQPWRGTAEVQLICYRRVK